jgi:hypothetical protein
MTNLLALIGSRANVSDEPLAPRAEDVPYARTWAPVSLEAEILAVLAEAPMPGERLAFAFKHKEQRLGALFARLSVVDSRELHRRCTLALPGDELAASFRRLVPDRQARLLAFVADVRRRQAMQIGHAVRGGSL